MKNKGNSALVSVIIPVYNAQDFIKSALQSVLEQTYDNYEIICIDDGSTDATAGVIRQFMQNHQCIRLIQTENRGQGHARNLGLKEAKGKYILFLDSDDKFDSRCMELAVSRAEKDDSDIVVFDYLYYHPATKTINYKSENSFYHRNILHESECLELLEQRSPIYSTNKMYRNSFLIKNKISFGENYIYEDWEFVINAMLNAKKVSTIHAPICLFTVNKESSTRTKRGTDYHVVSYIKAIKKCIDLINTTNYQLSNDVKFKFASYFLFRFVLYYNERCPKQFRKFFADQFMNEYFRLDFAVEKVDSLMTLLCYLKKYKVKNSFLLRFSMWTLYKVKPNINKLYKNFLKLLRNNIKLITSRIKKNKPALTLRQAYREHLKGALYEDVILFYGYDNRYTGNSRYLFEQMLVDKPKGVKLFFITRNGMVPLGNRVRPNSDRSERFMARAKTIIFESWIPSHYQHRENTTWIQLWHGTPIKRLLFDSNEKYITERNPDNKKIKYADIQRWDYLLVDSVEAIKFFKSAFFISEKKFLLYGYPRVKYLLDKKNDSQFRLRLRSIYGLPADKKIILYLPTWRDRNYKVDQDLLDLSYLLDLNDLKDSLGDEYEIVYKDHAFLSRPEDIEFKNYRTCETQELLLIADMVVTDYSSVIFDALAIDLQVLLYTNDFQKFTEERGVYEEVWNDLKPLVCETQDALVESIINYKNNDLCNDLKNKYCYKPEIQEELSSFIYKHYYTKFNH